MRPLAMMFCWLIHGCCHAQLASLASCMNQLAADPRFALLAGKVAVGNVTSGPPGMLTDSSLANNKERGVISKWAAARGECINFDSRYGNVVYRPPLQAHGIDTENKVLAAAVALYNREISFGEFNRQRQAIAEELRAKVADLSRQIQSQRTAQQHADWQTREREHMQREIEEAELLATMARQQVEKTQKDVTQFPTRASQRDGPRRYQPVSIAPFRNCFRFGSRMTCTGW
jgi:hypothetical protein